MNKHDKSEVKMTFLCPSQLLSAVIRVKELLLTSTFDTDGH